MIFCTMYKELMIFCTVDKELDDILHNGHRGRGYPAQWTWM